MLHEILKLNREDRDKFLNNIPPTISAHIFNNVYTMTEELCLNEIEDIETRVEMRYKLIQAFPDIVFWDFAEYYSLEGEVIRLDNILISTDGCCIVRLYDGKLTVTVSRDPHHKHYVRITREGKRWSLHRLIGSTLIPIPERLSKFKASEIYINHKDGIRNSNDISNLEWVTNRENQRHALNFENYLEEDYFLFEVIIDNGFKGRKFVLDVEEIKIFNLTYLKVKTIERDRNNGMRHGMKVNVIKKKEIGNYERGFPKDISLLFFKNKNYFNITTIPIVGEVIKGPFTGTKFSLIGENDIRKNFRLSAVKACSNGHQKTSHNCIFKKCSMKKAIELHDNLTPEIVKTLKKI